MESDMPSAPACKFFPSASWPLTSSCRFNDPAACNGQRRTVSDLLQMGDHGNLLRPEATEFKAILRRPLYCAHRNVGGSAEPSIGLQDWPLDCVTYFGGLLPTGELIRSVGHWNGPEEWEMFEVVSGVVHLLMKGPAYDDVHVLGCQAGVIYMLIPGCWHTSYVRAGDARVMNRYSTTTGPEPSQRAKYENNVAAPLVTLGGYANTEGPVFSVPLSLDAEGVVSLTHEKVPTMVLEGLQTLAHWSPEATSNVSAALGEAAAEGNTPAVRIVGSAARG